MKLLKTSLLLGFALSAGLALKFSASAQNETAATQTARGATIETTNFRAEIENGVLKSFRNKLTDEEYLNRRADMGAILPHIPAGLGTQTGEGAFAASQDLYLWPWKEFPGDKTWPNHHFPDAQSTFAFANNVLTYTNLSDGKNRFPDESFSLEIGVEAATGDLLVTPSGKSARAGVFAANFNLAPTGTGISVEAPIFDGVRLTNDMASTLWRNKWPENWDYQFLALNGSQAGAVGVWAQDADFHYKDLFFRPTENQAGIALSFGTTSTPPFGELKESRGVTWHLQSFEKGWSQAAKRFRDWRLANEKIAPRPEWTKHISFVNGGVNAEKSWLDLLSSYLGGEHLERTVTFAPVIRAAAFDTKHYDNTPYKGFKEQMPEWKKSGAHLMAYLQPMIMWGQPPTGNAEWEQAFKWHQEADTRNPFQFAGGKPITDPKDLKPADYVDQHHLGHKEFQTWFLNNVKSYIQDNGADGVYHDQSYPTPLDGRGLVNGMNPMQGMADYFYKAQTQNPDGIHGTEHMQEANNAGTSLGIGSGILWGPAPNMRKQRIEHPSPISNALHFPNGTIWSFPHFSDFGTVGNAQFYHWGMNLMEGRGDIPGQALQDFNLYGGKAMPFEQWRNELKLDRTRAITFVRNGLRPDYPEDWAPGAETYYKGAGGEDFRYEKAAWGTRFVRYQGTAAQVQYGRAHGQTHAPGDKNGGGNIAGWVFYNQNGPSGLHPDRYYVLDPTISRPAAYFSPGFTVMPSAPLEQSLYEGYVEDGAANEFVAYLKMRPLDAVGAITKSDKVLLHAPQAPVAVWVNGNPTPVSARDEGGEKVYEIGFNYEVGISGIIEKPATICVLLKQPAEGFADAGLLKPQGLARTISTYNTDLFDENWTSSRLTPGKRTLPAAPVAAGAAPVAPIEIQTLALPGGLEPPGARLQQVTLPLKAPAGKGGTLKIHVQGPWGFSSWSVNGVEQGASPSPLALSFKGGESKVVNFTAGRGFTLGFEWAETP